VHTLNHRSGLHIANSVVAGLDQRITSSDWRTCLPILHGAGVTLRELRASDAPVLFALLTTEEVARFISPPPVTIEGFARFIDWTRREQTAGRVICFGVVPHGQETPIGLIQVRSRDAHFTTAEWGFAIGSPFWGTGAFPESARAIVNFVMDAVGVHRLEARVAVPNGRGHGALQKLGAVQEGTMRDSFVCRGARLDEVLWSIVEDDWRRKTPWETKTVWGWRIH
jgi:ribosomal-protein-alanine N-acetyltransferase